MLDSQKPFVYYSKATQLVKFYSVRFWLSKYSSLAAEMNYEQKHRDRMIYTLCYCQKTEEEKKWQESENPITRRRDA